MCFWKNRKIGEKFSQASEQRVIKQDDGRYTILLFKEGFLGRRIKYTVKDLNKSTIERIIKQFNEINEKDIGNG